MPWYGEREKVRIRTLLGQQAVAAAKLLADTHRADLGTAYPPASRREQYPRKRSGNLQAAVDYSPKSPIEAVNRGGCDVFVDTGRAAYIRRLLNMGRKGISDTMNRLRARMKSILGNWSRG
jgi:hypothetical protein